MILAAMIVSCALSGCEKKSPAETPRWQYAVGPVICVGDSLTEGAYFGEKYSAVLIDQNFPYYLSRMLNTEVVNAGKSGYSASDWYPECFAQYDWSKYSTAFIWLGTNYAPTDTLEEDVLAYSDPESYAETETGYYCRLIEGIRRENPECSIVLLNIFASESDVEEANRAIAAIAAHYGLLLIDVSDLGAPEHPELHAGSDQNPHFGKAGYICVASRVVDALQAYFAEDPMRCEFGITLTSPN